jgi:hypothetical protein
VAPKKKNSIIAITCFSYLRSSMVTPMTSNDL